MAAGSGKFPATETREVFPKPAGHKSSGAFRSLIGFSFAATSISLEMGFNAAHLKGGTYWPSADVALQGPDALARWPPAFAFPIETR